MSGTVREGSGISVTRTLSNQTSDGIPGIAARAIFPFVNGESVSV